MESKIQKTNSSSQLVRISLTSRPMPNGSFAMEIVMNAPAMQSIPNHKRKGGTYAVALSSSSQSMQIPLQTSSTAHQASRFLNWSSDATSHPPLNVEV